MSRFLVTSDTIDVFFYVYSFITQNKLSVKHQLHSTSRKFNAFEQIMYNCYNPAYTYNIHDHWK